MRLVHQHQRLFAALVHGGKRGQALGKIERERFREEFERTGPGCQFGRNGNLDYPAALACVLNYAQQRRLSAALVAVYRQ
nr:hypothetical protein [Sulfuricella denitrificans]